MVLRSVVGYLIFLCLACVLSTNRDFLQKKGWKYVGYGIVLQLLLVFAMTHIPVIIGGIESVANGVMKLRDATIEGTKFVFGYVGGGELPFDLKEGGNTFVFALQALPTIIIVSIISAILTYLRIIPYLSKIIGSLFRWIFGVSNSLGMVASAKIFLGQFEAPMLIKAELNHISQAEMFTIMALAFSTASASLMPIYATAIASICPDAITHIVISSVIGVVSTLIICKIMMPEDEISREVVPNQTESIYPDFMTAVSKGTSDGAFVWWAIVGSLIGMVALIALINYILGVFPDIFGEPITLQRIFSLIMYPFAWVLGIADTDILKVSEIIGLKFVVNETVAYFDIVKSGMSSESAIATIYAITNFGNFACVGMTVGGLMALCPGRKDIPSLGFKAFVAGTLATGLTATLMGMFLK